MGDWDRIGKMVDVLTKLMDRIAAAAVLFAISVVSMFLLFLLWRVWNG